MRTCFQAFMVIVLATMFAGCAQVDVTKTSKGTYASTKADDIEILMTRPERSFEELATITVTGWQPSQSAKMHNALRAKSAPLGANAVILANSGVDQNRLMWATGVAIRWK